MCFLYWKSQRLLMLFKSGYRIGSYAEAAALFFFFIVKLQIFEKKKNTTTVCFLCCTKLVKQQIPWLTVVFQNTSPPVFSELCFYVTVHPLKWADTTKLFWLNVTTTNKIKANRIMLPCYLSVLLKQCVVTQPNRHTLSLDKRQENNTWDLEQGNLFHG